MIFEWDQRKAVSNLRKHGVTFAEAKSVFNDPFAISKPDNNSDAIEERWLELGLSHSGKLLVVWYTERDGCIRIIGCREATKTERRAYEDESAT